MSRANYLRTLRRAAKLKPAPKITADARPLVSVVYKPRAKGAHERHG